MDVHDAVVVGLGAMGGAAVRALAARGADVVGFDARRPPHTEGSSHGGSRIIRLAYFEDPVYVPLLRRAYELWRELEGAAGVELLLPTGGLMIGPPDSAIVTGARRSAEGHGLPHELYGPDELGDVAPGVALPAGEVALYEPDAGVLRPEAAVAAHLEVAVRDGADLRTGVEVLGWEVRDGAVTVRTAAGQHRARRLVLAAGPWLGALAPDGLPVEVERQVQVWVRPRGEGLGPGELPVFLLDRGDAPAAYGLPPVDDRGVKIALHHGGETGTPDTLARTVAAADVDAVLAALAEHLPGLGTDVADAAVCLYTNTPDHHFLLGHHPHHPEVVVAGGGSGHGFKFAPVVGEVAAALVAGEDPGVDIGTFDPSRFGA